jgi:hypothetical protein
MDEKEKLKNGMNVLNTIINETFCRHNDLTEEEYKERLKAKDSEFTEEQLVMVGLYNIMIELTKEVFRLQQKTNLTAGTIKLFLDEKEKQGGK